MNSIIKISGTSKNWLFIFMMGLLLIYAPDQVQALIVKGAHHTSLNNKPVYSVLNEIHKQLSNRNDPLHINYPGQINRLYLATGDKLLWLAPDTVKMHACDAMLILDCVLQYGLDHNDYHPGELIYDKLNLYTAKFSAVNFSKKARFDILLTDAMLTLMNHLHYGKLNTAYTTSKLDASGFIGFCAGDALMAALKSDDFTAAVVAVQPKSKAYRELQNQMHLVEGRYTAECYIVPEADIRKMAINMERLRWVNLDTPPFIQVNIPSATLKFITTDTTFLFKAIVGQPLSPTKLAPGVIDYFCVTPAGGLWQFKSKEKQGIIINGSEIQQVFRKSNRALGKGPVIVEQPNKLAALLLQQCNLTVQIPKINQFPTDGKTKTVELKKVVPVVFTYLTCEMKDGVMISYKDIYDQDNALEMALYNTKKTPVIKNKINLQTPSLR